MSRLEIKALKATPKDWPAISKLLEKTVKWLQSKGSSQWSGILEGRDSHNTEARIEKGQVYKVINEENELVGMFVLWDEQSDWDRDLWGEESSADYYYLHRVTTSREFAGQGLGLGLVKQSLAIAQKEGKKGVRLDCRADKPPLNNLYQKAGFKLVRTVEDYESGDEVDDFNLYEYNF